MKKPREFWIDPTPDNAEELADELDTAVYVAMDTHPKQGPLKWQANLIRVIEYSAYKNALDALAKYQQIVLDQELKIVDLEFDGT